MADLTPNVETLIRKAASAEKSEDAMRFSQAALNATNALPGVTYLRNSGSVIGYIREAGLRSLKEGNHTSVYPQELASEGYTIPVMLSGA